MPEVAVNRVERLLRAALEGRGMDGWTLTSGQAESRTGGLLDTLEVEAPDEWAYEIMPSASGSSFSVTAVRLVGGTYWNPPFAEERQVESNLRNAVQVVLAIIRDYEHRALREWALDFAAECYEGVHDGEE